MTPEQELKTQKELDEANAKFEEELIQSQYEFIDKIAERDRLRYEQRHQET